jgi:sugar lactone lactonase YvrE
MIRTLEEDLDTNRFNDGKVDPNGRFWAGTMDKAEKTASGSLYCLFPDLSVKKRETSITVSNGLTWSIDKRTMYYIDSPTQKVFAYDYDDSTGEISNKRVVFSINDNSFPDGMTVDEEGMLWVALWDGSSVIRFDPTNGSLLQRIAFPTSRVTSCCWGGEDLDTLYVTTARVGLAAEQLRKEPTAGGLFAVKHLGVKGTPTFEFAG